MHRCRGQPSSSFGEADSGGFAEVQSVSEGGWAVATLLFVGAGALELRSSNAWSFRALVSWRPCSESMHLPSVAGMHSKRLDQMSWGVLHFGCANAAFTVLLQVFSGCAIFSPHLFSLDLDRLLFGDLDLLSTLLFVP